MSGALRNHLLAPLLVPVQLQAFIFNPSVCNTGKDDDNGARIIPITQPNYTFLRLDNFVVQSDVLRHADLHNAAPAEKNSRATDLGARPKAVARRNRMGVYVHWILPQVYRGGPSQAEPAPGQAVPKPLQPPTRWIVVRKLDLKSVEPAEAASSFKEYQAWVVESDYLWNLDDIPADYDLEVDVSPFVVGVAGHDVDIVQQAEVFIGRKTPLESWTADQKASYTNISLLRSSNELFADFQLHNTNVFSILDNFAYSGDDGSAKYLSKADASYYLLGWHSTNDADPLSDSRQWQNRSERLKPLLMTLAGYSGDIPDYMTTQWLESSLPGRLCFHGALYHVKWDHDAKPASVPADHYAGRLRNQLIPALSVGTTPVDSLVAYCAARKGRQADTTAKLEEDILALDSLLHARDDGVEGQREAKDTVYNWNFSRTHGGAHFSFGDDTAKGRPARPGEQSAQALRDVNDLQQLLDGCRRLAQQRHWDMFSLWWKYVSDVANKTESSTTNSKFQLKADGLSAEIDAIHGRAEELEGKVRELLQGGLLASVKSGTLPFFYRARDPTLLIGGVGPGWPSDFSKDIKARLLHHIAVPENMDIPDALRNLARAIQAAFSDDDSQFLMFPVVMPHPLVAAEALLLEFYALLPENNPPDQPPEMQLYPQFHDKLDGGETWRDQWGGRQPWFPLYVEWEAEYTHVPFDLWALDEYAVRASEHKTLRYGINTPGGKPLWDKMKEVQPTAPDVRIISGRVLVLPQASFSLAAKVRQLFAETPPRILKERLKKVDRDELLKKIDTLSYISCPLRGLTDGLLTLCHGTHIKPLNKEIDSNGEMTNNVIKAAEFGSAGFTTAALATIQGNSALTPFAASTDFTSTEYCPFKPVTHGQMRFRKLNVVDKFGQALGAIDPAPRKDGPPPLYPCISQFYKPQPLKLRKDDDTETEVANTVLQNRDTNCEFVQLPPQINQPARLNAEFVVPSGGTGPYWRPAADWENPIWGWLVINYADHGLQLFLADGTFYGEVRIGGPTGALASPRWAPFNAPPAGASADTARLDALIEQFTKDPQYLVGFWGMVTEAASKMAATPSAYAQFLGAVVGRPLALVNTGWSVELEGPPMANQSTASKVTGPERTLLSSSESGLCYEFQVKIGDGDREYDGLVGYFDGRVSRDEATHEDLVYDYIHTYFPPPPPKDSTSTGFGDKLRPITTKTFPIFRPFWVSPMLKAKDSSLASAVGDYAAQRDSHLRVLGALVDPFTPVHGFSSFLPAKTLSLAPWTWNDAMGNMMAFLRAGPLTLVREVPAFDSAQRLTLARAKERPTRNVELPGGLQAGEWSWLQPFVDEKSEEEWMMPPPPPPLGRHRHPGRWDMGETPPPPVFNAFGVEKRGNLLKPGFEGGPYTAVEGYLLLRRPIMEGKPEGAEKGRGA